MNWCILEERLSVLETSLAQRLSERQVNPGKGNVRTIACCLQNAGKSSPRGILDCLFCKETKPIIPNCLIVL